MDHIKRRDFMGGAALGALAFTVGGAQILLTAREARAQGVPFRLLKAGEAETIEALGETLVPGARRRASRISSIISFRYPRRRRCSKRASSTSSRRTAISTAPPRRDRSRRARPATAADLRSLMRRSSAVRRPDAPEQVEGWQGPRRIVRLSAARSDAVDVVFGTMEGYAGLGIPYMPHIAPDKRW